jgi:Rhs element Vgr protein
MADSPLNGSEGVLRVSVSSDGNALPQALQLISVVIKRSANTIPSARLVLLDGDMPNQSFPVSDAAWFKPGAAISIKAGYGDGEDTLFEGIVIKHAVRISGDNDARLVIECRDKAMVMAIGRKNANYVDQKDSDIISALAGNAGLGADVEATSIQHKELAQFYCSDWDFMLSRADVNGLLVIATDGKLAVKSPDVAGAAVLKVGYGTDLIEFQAEIDARTQFSQVQGVAWDPKTQAALLGSPAAPEALNAQGDLDSSALAKVIGLSSLRLQSGATQTRETLDAWAKAQQRKAGLARVRGHMKFQGSAKTAVGSLIELVGVGKHFSGTVFVGALEHVIEDGNWVTEAEFGLAPNWFAERSDIVGTAAAGLLPPVEGLQIGVVMKLDEDPEGEHRIQVQLPVLQAATQGIWARLAKFHGSNAFGAFFVPEIGDEVLLGYLHNDPCHPVVLGSLYSSKHPPPYALEAKNDTKAIVTRCLSKIEFKEEDKIITVITPAGNQIVLSDKDQSILLKDQNGNSAKLDPGGITIDSPKDIKVTAKGTITIDAVGAIGITSKADVKSAGLNVNCEAQVGFVGKGSASAELSAAGQTTVKGAMVMIN